MSNQTCQQKLRLRISDALETLRYAHSQEFPTSGVILNRLAFGPTAGRMFMSRAPTHYEHPHWHNLMHAMTFHVKVDYWFTRGGEKYAFWYTHEAPVPTAQGGRGFYLKDDPVLDAITEWCQEAERIHEQVDTASRVTYRICSAPWSEVCRAMPKLASLVDADGPRRYARSPMPDAAKRKFFSQWHTAGELYFDHYDQLVAKALMIEGATPLPYNLNIWVHDR